MAGSSAPLHYDTPMGGAHFRCRVQPQRTAAGGQLQVDTEVKVNNNGRTQLIIYRCIGPVVKFAMLITAAAVAAALLVAIIRPQDTSN